MQLQEAVAVSQYHGTDSGQPEPGGMILCWYQDADGEPSVGAGSWMFLGFPETGTTGNFVSAEGWAAEGSGLGQEPPWFPARSSSSSLPFGFLTA